MNIPDKITVEVTEEDIALGKPQSSSYCPIARAARRALEPFLSEGELAELRAGYLYLKVPAHWSEPGWIAPGSDTIGYDTPEDAYAFMNKLDSGDDVAPSTFTFSRTKGVKI